MLDKLRRWRIKLFQWEYWPMWAVYLPVSFYYVYLSIRARSFFFFTASNPSIETGGMFFESKWSIFKLLPKETYPTTLFIAEKEDFETILEKLKMANLKFPMVAKPDRGERGWAVKILHSVDDLKLYLSEVSVDILLQAYIDYPIELSIFYHRIPGANIGMISSVTSKIMLSITGDGISSIEQLIRKSDRAFLQLIILKSDNSIDFNKVLNKGEKSIMVPYGNHVRGAMFEDFKTIIDDRLTQVFDEISKKTEGFYYGRYDLRCESIELLKQGIDFAILELNGAGAEPAHIYQPGFSYFKAQKVLAQHYKIMFDISRKNKQNGEKYMTFAEILKLRKLEKAYKSKVKAG